MAKKVLFILKVCPVCGKIHYIQPCFEKRGARFCSNKCRGISRRKQYKIMNGIEHKHCAECSQWKLLNTYSKGKQWDGLSHRCKECDKQYQIANAEKISRYKKERWKRNRPILTEKNCEWCNGMFMPVQKNQRFCSKNCIGFAYRFTHSEELKQQRMEYHEQTRAKRGITKSGSPEHKEKISGPNSYNWVERLEGECLGCGKLIQVYPGEIRKFCSLKCYWKYAKGENHWVWKKDRSKIVRRKGKEFSLKCKLFIKQRDKMICQLCGILTFDDGNASVRSCNIDHIIPIKDGGDDDINNGRVLCRKCNQSRPENMVIYSAVEQ